MVDCRYDLHALLLSFCIRRGIVIRFPHSREGLHSPSIQSPSYEAILQMILFAEDDNGFGCDRFEIWLVLWVGN